MTPWRETNRFILSEDTDFRGADPELDVEHHPGILACDTTASAGEIAAAIRRIEMYTDDLTGTVLYVPGNWLWCPQQYQNTVKQECETIDGSVSPRLRCRFALSLIYQMGCEKAVKTLCSKLGCDPWSVTVEIEVTGGGPTTQIDMKIEQPVPIAVEVYQ